MEETAPSTDPDAGAPRDVDGSEPMAPKDDDAGVGNADAAAAVDASQNDPNVDAGPARQMRCPDPLPVEHGLFSVTRDTEASATAELRCEPGYEQQGEGQLRCDAPGEWQGDPGACIAKDCGAPNAPDHGSIRFEGTTLGKVSVVECDDGYVLIGAETLTCTTAGTWSETTPRCARILFKESFEDGLFANGNYGSSEQLWTSSSSNFATDTGRAADGSQSLMLAGSVPFSRPMVHLFDTLLTPGYVSWRVRANRTDRVTGYFVACPSADDCSGIDALIWSFLNDDGHMYSGVKYEADRWYHMELRNIDWKARRADLFVDGLHVQTSTLPETVNGLQRISLLSYSGDLDTISHWDDIVIAE